MKVEYAKCTTERNSRYSINTLIIEKNGKKFVRKQANTELALSHIKRMAQNYEMLRTNIRSEVVLCAYELGEDCIDFEYLEGETLESRLYREYDRDDFDQVLAIFKEYDHFLNYYSNKYSEFEKTPAFLELFGAVGDFEGMKAITPGNIDLILSNIILLDGEYGIIDYEWVFDFSLPVKFLLFRGIAGYYSKDKRHVEDYDKVLAYFDFSEKQQEQFIDMSRSFEAAVYGVQGEGNISKNRFLKESFGFEKLMEENRHLHKRVEDLDRNDVNLKKWVEQLILERNHADVRAQKAEEEKMQMQERLEQEQAHTQQQVKRVEREAVLERKGLITQLEQERGARNQLEEAYRRLEGISTKGHLKLVAKGVYNKIFKTERSKKRFKDFAFTLLTPAIHNKQLYKQWKASKKQQVVQPDQTLTAQAKQEEVADKNRINIFDTYSAEERYIRQITSIPTQKERNAEYKECEQANIANEEIDIKAIAFYLPQYHPFPENNAWWGEGFTEWANVGKAMPLFTGHFQPRLPADLGYYDLRLKENIKKQMEMAKQYGIHGFAMYYYWFDGKKLMDTPLNIIYENKDLDLPFCLCWANENWTRTWDGEEKNVLIAQEYTRESMLRFAQDILPYLKDERYIKINGKPALIVYNPGDIPEFESVVLDWREYFRMAGIGEITLLCVSRPNYFCSDANVIDAYVEFPPHSVVMQGLRPYNNAEEYFVNDDFGGLLYHYADIVSDKNYLQVPDYKQYKGIMLAWDNTPRRGDTATIFNGFSMKLYQEWLNDLVEYTDEQFAGEDKVIFINAWNEWAEGTYLEPDRRYGYAALAATQQALLRRKPEKREIIFVGHDALFNGAQVLAYHIIKQLKEVFGYDVYTILQDGGELEEKIRHYSKVLINVTRDIDSTEQLEQTVRRWNVKKAICNTVVTGDMVGMLADMGVSCVSLIHEMQNIIQNMHAVDKLSIINQKAKKIVFPSSHVEYSDQGLLDLDADKTVIMPQGLFSINPYIERKPETRDLIREKLGIPKDAKIVLGAGTMDIRKGIDLFADCAIRTAQQCNNIYYVWIGDCNLENFEEVVVKKCNDAGVLDSKRLIFIPAQPDIRAFYVAADLFLLTSREDPFPSVVVESMHAGVPVVAFRDSGGFADIIDEQTGLLVEKENTRAMTEAVIELLNDATCWQKKSQACRELVETRLDFVDYIEKLLCFLNEKITKVSVIIPNYNYERYLRSRIDSVLEQTYPVYEIILMDDRSTDESVSILKEYKERYPHKIKLVMNEQNSGSVFAQWEKGLDMAKGDYIWIAEADDLADPMFIEKNMEKFKQDSDVVMSYTQSKQIDSNGNLIGNDYLDCTSHIEVVDYDHDFIIDAECEIVNGLSVLNSVLNVSSVMFKNRDFTGFIEEAKKLHVAGDWMFYVKLLEQGGKIAYIREALNYHRRHQNSVTLQLNTERHFSEIILMQDYVRQNHQGVDEEKVFAYRKQVKEHLGLNGNISGDEDAL
ncbi:MAG: glycoside hydrolase family 99-like domain-containing protein [Christensenella sp.]|uniref:glycoside hydrolase family 99-like domain-containing protein n=1 Tax=Christensenella sp. TaxID=1935934 RepID=UPI002B2214EB|nr:glycoside hydrolase family 99-like domain-containing protein [Christensenella sp.]MEA5003916.1 glycoside hydrolase family 99-like domain-containing protein [Christensenella sp.]